MYDHALTAALTIMEEMERRHLQKHEMLSLLVFSILTTLQSYEDNRREITSSANQP